MHDEEKVKGMEEQEKKAKRAKSEARWIDPSDDFPDLRLMTATSVS